MATYYPSVSYPRDYLSTPCLSDQSTSLAGTPPHPSNSPMYLNQPSSSGAFSDILSGSSLTLQNGVAITTVGGRNEMSFIPPTSNSESLQSVNGQLSIQASNVMHNSVSMDPQTMPRTVMNNLDGEQSFQTQGLSLSLGTQIPSGVSVPSFQYQYQGYPSLFSNFVSFSGKGTLTCSIDEVKSNDIRNIEGIGSGFAGASGTPSETEALSHPQYSLGHKVVHSDIYHYGPGFANPTLNTKYLKATQDLLDEVVNIHKALKQPDPDKDQTSQSKPSNGVSSDPSESITNSNSELSPAERQELQNKKTKLMAMLDEVDRRYRQYYHQMKIVVTSFDVIAGSGAAKPYTALAIQTISRHFRTLRDAISGQVQVARKSLGQEDTSSNSPGAVIPRLRYVDHQLKQQRALQQLGVTRHAWRPQRGLPESSVSILRAWLFEHFLHPYPKDSEKIMLAKQTGLTRNQVANWFINARVRLWKPMIEDMYKEEFGEKDENSKSSLEKTEKPPGEDSSASDDRKEDLQDSMTSKVSDANCVQPGTIQNFNFDHMPNAEIHGQVETSVFESGSHADITSSAGAARLQVIQGPKMDSVYPDSMLTSSQNGNNSFMAGAGMYDLTELGGFAGGNQVSLALGLQHQQNNVFSLSGDANMQRNNRVTSASEPDTVDFHCTDPANEQNRPMYYMIL